MEKYYTQTIGTPVVGDSGQLLSRVSDLILNPDSGKIVAFKVASVGRKMIVPFDILSWNNVIMVHDEEDLLDYDDIHQVREILKKDIRIYKNRVVTKDKTYLGHVVNFAVNQTFFCLTKIVVAKTFLGIFTYSKLIIDSKDIIKITNDHIVVRNPLRPIAVPKLKVDVAPTM